MQHHALSLDDAAVARLAERAAADPRSVLRRLAGLRVRGRVGARIDAAIEEMMRAGDVRAAG